MIPIPIFKIITDITWRPRHTAHVRSSCPILIRIDGMSHFLLVPIENVHEYTHKKINIAIYILR